MLISIIYHILVVGYPIYNGKNDQDILNNIKNNIIIYDKKDWKLVNKLHIQLIKLLLERDLSKRKSANYILNYFMTKNNIYQ